MSTLAVTNLKHESATGNNIVLDSSGNVAFADGSASAPSITNDGDTNTGIYFPAADNIGFATNGVIRGRWTTDGLCFGSDTAAANALDDYEEGTWTPTLGGTSVTYSTQIGRYVKIGAMVFVRGRLTITGGTPNAIIQNLPVTSSSSPEWISMNLWHSGGITFPASTTYISGYVSHTATTAVIEAGGSAVGSSAVTVANSANFYFAFYYSTN